MFGRRPDATPVRDANALRRFMPFISPRRNDSLVYFAQDVDVEDALAFVEKRNLERAPERPLTLFHVLLAAMARMFHERPRLNRFTAGGRLWQRDGVWITFSAKLRFDEDAPIITVKRRIDAVVGLEEMVDGLLDSVDRTRRGEKSTTDLELGLLLRLPPFLIRACLAGVHGLDALGLLPRSMIDSDPMYCSMFVANLGSVGIEAGYHHLWEHGNCPAICTIGRVKLGPDGRRIATLKYSYDERVEDGLYCAAGLELIRELVANPERLV